MNNAVINMGVEMSNILFPFPLDIYLAEYMYTHTHTHTHTQNAATHFNPTTAFQKLALV
jgi:hypothetical protein